MAPSDMPEIGKNIALVRKEKNMSLDELSKRSGVSIGMLSQIEKDKVNPTIAVVWKIAYGLSVSFKELVSNEEEKKIFHINRNQEAVLMERDNGKVIFRLLSPLSLVEKFEIYTIEFKNNGVLISDPHVKGTEEFVTVVKGKVEVNVEKNQAIIFEGDTINFHADIKHVISNKDDGVSVIYMVVKYP